MPCTYSTLPAPPEGIRPATVSLAAVISRRLARRFGLTLVTADLVAELAGLKPEGRANG